MVYRALEFGAEILRCAQDDRAKRRDEKAEERRPRMDSGAMKLGAEILRCAQDDRTKKRDERAEEIGSGCRRFSSAGHASINVFD